MSKIIYHTKQRDIILGYLKKCEGEHVTAGDIVNHFAQTGEGIATATIYRQLEKLVDEGIVKKYILDLSSPACFEYIGADSKCFGNECTHLKCTECGKLIHLHCDDFMTTQKHIYSEHNFKLDMTRTVLYGMCGDCMGNRNRRNSLCH